jgi:SAM-dependent methyltransferase
VNWHDRYVQQAAWTRRLRLYLFERAGLARARRVLEVGCGTGAILADMSTPASIHGLDLAADSLLQARLHAPAVMLTRGDALALPYARAGFDITCCHFLLLWVSDPLQALSEMKRVTRPGGYVLALAEPDYTGRIDEPEDLAPLGRWQTESLRRQGADPGLGRRLADLFYRAGITILETGPMQAGAGEALTPAERENEWNVLEADLAGTVPEQDLNKLRLADARAWSLGTRRLHVPTYFACGQV